MRQKKVIKKSWKVIKRNIWLMVAIALIDAVFLFAFAKTYSEFFRFVAPYLQTLNQALTTGLGQFAQTSDVEALNQSLAAFRAARQTVFLATAYFFAITVGLWTVFQGVIWRLVQRARGTKQKLRHFVWKFFLTSLAGWTVLLGVLLLGSWWGASVSGSRLPLFSIRTVWWMIAILALLVFFLLHIAYSVLDRKKFWRSFWNALKSYRIVGGAVLIITVIAGLLLWVFGRMVSAAVINGPAALGQAFAFGLVIALPILAMLRVYLATACKSVTKKS